MFRTKVIPYAVIELDLGNARSDYSQGSVTIKGNVVGTWMANTLTVLTTGGGSFSFKLNDSDYDGIDASDGLKIEGIPFKDILWTNTAQTGKTAKVFIAWVY